ncbi:hypothetical protein B9Z65_4401 [Elsinoe australis]|uniref:F-box domain-containing protein n=1 Tax=Elsinoe australis TaxID=40998 RepID=A0A2P7Z2Q0_9PEZI|nr:hypothetical protein B9Z65_4401 [Elsinoe australis]
MHINALPLEVLHQIFKEAATSNKKEGVTFTYGLGHANTPIQSNKLTRHVRGPVSADSLRWDSTSSIRQVCRLWHDWAIRHALRDLYLRRWRGSERWAELPIERRKYDIYELIDRPTGCAVYRDPYGSLRQTAQFFADYPELTDRVERLWFNGFYTPESEALIFKVLRSCKYLTNISIPWTMLRHGSGQDWLHLLGIANNEDVPVESLELQAVCLPDMMTYSPDVSFDKHPLNDPRVSFANLKRLKLIGNTTFMPVNDADLLKIAETATNLGEFHVTCLSTVTIAGVMAIVKASSQTLRVLDHSPRSDDGFYHPDPGVLAEGDHACEILTSCPNLHDLSISIPSMCADLFANESVKWSGECQVRALKLCSDPSCSTSPGTSPVMSNREAIRRRTSSSSSSSEARSLFASRTRAGELQKLLDQARALTVARERHRKRLDIELFFADCIFDPAERVVHGDFAIAEVVSYGNWPSAKVRSGKGPYGSTGLYGKGDGDWECVSEGEWARGVEGGWVRV